MDFKESDLYSPVCNYFTELGYDVQAEVKSCDLIAKKDSEIIIAELKKNFCLKLVYQAIERQSITDSVYVVIPRPKKGAKGSEWNNMLKLMKKLNIGIITVAVDSPLKTVDIVSVPESVSVPKSSKKRSSCLLYTSFVINKSKAFRTIFSLLFISIPLSVCCMNSPLQTVRSESKQLYIRQKNLSIQKY